MENTQEHQEDLDLELDFEDDTVDSVDESNEDESNDSGLSDSSELDRARRENAKLQRLLNKKSKQGNSNSPDIEELKTEMTKIRLEAKGYDEAQIEFIMRNGGIDSIKNPAVRAGLNAIKEQLDSEKASVSNASTKSKQDTKYSVDEIRTRELSSKEIENLIREGKVISK